MSHTDFSKKKNTFRKCLLRTLTAPYVSSRQFCSKEVEDTVPAYYNTRGRGKIRNTGVVIGSKLDNLDWDASCSVTNILYLSR